MEYKADALVLRAVDYGENDKMVTLLTAERGKLGAGMKGVKKAGAKLNFASQPFCFAEYVLAERGGRYTVTQASLHEGFFGLRLDLNKYYAGAGVLEVCDAFAGEGMPCGSLLVAAIEALSAIETSNEAPMSALLAFLLRAVKFAGYPVTAGNCAVCGGKMTGRRHFDMASGSFNCSSCAVGVPASEVTYEAIRAILLSGHPDQFSGHPDQREGPHNTKSDIDQWDSEGGNPPQNDRGDGEIRALRLLKSYIAYHTETDLRALSEFLALQN